MSGLNAPDGAGRSLTRGRQSLRPHKPGHVLMHLMVLGAPWRDLGSGKSVAAKTWS